MLSENEREKTLLTNCHLVGIGYWHSAKKESRWIDGREVIYIKEAELYEVSLMSGFASGAIKNAFATYGHVDYSMTLREECSTGKYKYDGAAVRVTRALQRLL